MPLVFYEGDLYIQCLQPLYIFEFILLQLSQCEKILRILLLGGTGVGKSSFGNQIVGGQNVFEVGHALNSKTTKIEWTSQQFFGDGQCVTVIDTPGFFDTEGNDYEQSLKMQEQLRREFPYIDVFVLVMKGSSTRSRIMYCI